jgi:hypothetical protein
MADQAVALRRLVRARLDWKELTEEPSAPRPVEEGGGLRAFLEAAESWRPFRRAGLGLVRKAGRGPR